MCTSPPFKCKQITVRPDWICTRVVSLERPGKGHQPLWIWFFNFGLKVLKKFWSSETLHTKLHLVLLPVGITSCMVTNRNIFRQAGLQICGGKSTNGLWIETRVWGKNCTIPQSKPEKCTFWRIFSWINVRQPIGRKNSIQTVILPARGWNQFCMKRLRPLKS